MVRSVLFESTACLMLMGLISLATPTSVSNLAYGGDPPALPAITQVSSSLGTNNETSGNIAGPPNVTIQLVAVGTNPNSPVVTAIAIDPRGEFLAASGDDHVIRILERKTFRLVANLFTHEDWVQSMDFSPDGEWLVSVANDGQMVTWNRSNNWQAQVEMTEMPALRSVRYSPTGQTIATVGFSPELFLLGVKDNVRPSLNCGCRDLRTVDFRGDGKVVVAAGRSGDVHLFDAVTGSTIDDVKLSRRRIREVRFIGSSNRLFTAGEDGHVVIYDVDTKQILHDLAVVDCKLMTGCVVNSNHIAVGGSDNSIRIFDIQAGVQIDELVGHTGTIASLKSVDGMLYSGSYDTTVRRWNLRGLLATETVAEAGENSAPVIRTSRLP